MKNYFRIYSFATLFIFVLFLSKNAKAEVELPSFFTNNMVLQQQTKVPLWGTATPNATLRIHTSWNNKTYTLTADENGHWEKKVKTPKYGGPYQITFDDGKKITMDNVLIGEVWLCSGQSNMEMPLEGWGKITNYKEEIRNANYPEIRLLQAARKTSTQPLDELALQHEGWRVCSPQTIADFSATAYFFAREIYKEKHIPIGLIHSSWGGTVAEAWTSAGALREIHDFDAMLDLMDAQNNKEASKEFKDLMQEWYKNLEEEDKGYKNGEPLWVAPEVADSDWKIMKAPSNWGNEALSHFNGAVWFRKTVKVPQEMRNKVLTLNYLVDDNDRLWFNGHYIGATEGFTKDRHYTIPKKYLTAGDNTITIRVYDQEGDGGIYGSPNEFTLKSDKTTLSLAGDWKYKIGIDLKDLPPRPYIPSSHNRPTVLYNAMIHPLLKLPIKGVIWYQGESNAGRAAQYRYLFPALIKDWRDKFGQKKLPFYFVQLANFQKQAENPGPSDWAELREAQFQALSLRNTGMAVTIDIGDANDIHPKNKQDVGKRLAKIALAKNYGMNIPYSGPTYKSSKIKKDKILISLNHAKGLTAKTKGRALKGFSIAGPDRTFHWANATIVDGEIAVSSPKVSNPVAVRYGWATNPDVNLYNEAGLPASPFRTDDWPGVTANKK